MRWVYRFDLESDKHYFYPMKKILWFFTVAVLFAACDDGDFTIETLDFDQNSVAVCDDFVGEITFFVFDDTREEVLFVNTTALPDDIVPITEGQNILTTGTTIEYNVFDGDASDFFCQSIPPTTPSLVQQWAGSFTSVVVNTTVSRDDNDGLDEEINDAIDTDGDGIPDYYDSDDDGDNVDTSVELMIDEDGNFADTDGDGTPNYLDTDDDGDGVLTRNEVTDANDTNPAGNVNEGNVLANYLLPSIADEVQVSSFRQHTYQEDIENEIIINDLVITDPNGNTETFEGAFDFGTNMLLNQLRSLTPDFN